MSGWKVITRNLQAAGGGPCPAKAFDDIGMSASAFRVAILSATTHGLIRNTVRSYGKGRQILGLWELTPLGWDWCEGRVVLVYPDCSLNPGRGGQKLKGARLTPSATWLKALPRAGEIALRQE